MMFESFQESAHRVLFFARYEAGRLKLDGIDVQHLLLGFILEDQGDGDLHVWKGFGVNATGEGVQPPVMKERDEPFLDAETAVKLQSAFSGIGVRAEPQPMHGDMPLTEAARTVLGRAAAHANGMPVSALHLLLAMLAAELGFVSAGLIRNGVTRQRIEEEMRRRADGKA